VSAAEAVFVAEAEADEVDADAAAEDRRRWETIAFQIRQQAPPLNPTTKKQHRYCHCSVTRMQTPVRLVSVFIWRPF